MGKHRQSPEEQWGPDRPVPPPPRPAPALYVPEPQEPLEPLEPLGQGGGQEPGPGEVYDWQREDWSETGCARPVGPPHTRRSRPGVRPRRRRRGITR